MPHAATHRLIVAAGGWLTLAGIEPVAAAADTLAATSPRPAAVLPSVALADAAVPRATGPLPWTRGPSAGARGVAATIADEAVRLPGGTPGLLVAGVALLGAAFATARVVTRPRANGASR